MNCGRLSELSCFSKVQAWLEILTVHRMRLDTSVLEDKHDTIVVAVIVNVLDFRIVKIAKFRFEKHRIVVVHTEGSVRGIP